ncbi:hypothetical protein [Paenibacillus naphthalenovorans]|uniref:hypothetical protein n=1 Tax=Paenibacillus naphthalenovorans TaxID=162209 RepID=UPI003D2E21E0
MFDITKYGYLNLTPHPFNSHYKKELFEARRHIIMESNLYNAVHKKITKVIGEHTGVSSDPLLVADLGCGDYEKYSLITTKKGLIQIKKRCRYLQDISSCRMHSMYVIQKNLMHWSLITLIQMTPLTWSMDKARFDAFKYRNFNRDYSRFGHFSRELVSGNYS